MKIKSISKRSGLLAALLVGTLSAAEPLYTQEGTDPPFAAVLERSGIKPGTRFSKVTVTGSRIDVNNELLAKQVGETGAIPKDIGLHTQASNGKDKNGNAILWPFHIRMSDEGNIYFKRRRSVPGLEDEIVIAENMVGKSLRIKVRANGADYEVYQKPPLDGGPWKFVTQGSFMGNKDRGISFRWGMYCGSKTGISIKKDALLFVTGVTIR